MAKLVFHASEEERNKLLSGTTKTEKKLLLSRTANLIQLILFGILTFLYVKGLI